MALEAPTITVFITKQPHPDVSIAALGLVATLSFVIETPVLGLLSTATALVSDRQHYQMVRNFAYAMMALVTLAAAVFVLTPAFDWVTGSLLAVPDSVASAAKKGMLIMIPWSAGVGFRRYAQGILIRNGITRPMTIGTALRLTTMAVMGWTVLRLTNWSGVQLGCVAWCAGVWVEAVYIQIVCRPTIRKIAAVTNDGHTKPPLTHRALLSYHFPLTLANLLWLIARPMFVWALSQGQNPTLNLASLEASNQLMFLFRASAFALPEAVLALSSREGSSEALRRFSIKLGTWISAIQYLACALGIAGVIYIGLLTVPAETAYKAIVILIIISPVTFLATYQGFLKGRLSYLRKTSGLTWSIGLHVVSVAAMMLLLVSLGQAKVETVAIAILIATVAETAFLQWYLRAATRQNSLAKQ